MNSSKRLKQKPTSVKNSLPSWNGLLKEGDAEFLLQQVKNGKYKIRVGQIWQIKERKGQTALQLDLDNCKSYSRHSIRKRLAQCGIILRGTRSRVSPGGHGLHVVVWINGRFSPMAIVALQAILESDPAREAQNFRRATQKVKQWRENWRVLFE